MVGKETSGEPWQTSVLSSCLLLYCFCYTPLSNPPGKGPLSTRYSKTESAKTSIAYSQRSSARQRKFEVDFVDQRQTSRDSQQIEMQCHDKSVEAPQVNRKSTCHVILMCPPVYASTPTRCSPFSILSPVARHVLRPVLATSKFTICFWASSAMFTGAVNSDLDR